MLEAPAMMAGPGPLQNGQGEDHGGYSSSMALSAIKNMYPQERAKAVASDVGFQIREHELKWNIDSVNFSIKRKEIKNPRNGKIDIDETMVFDKFGGKSLQDVTNSEEFGVWDRVNRIARSVGDSKGESWHVWLSPGREDRLYIAHRMENGEGELQSVRLHNRNDESRFNLIESLSGGEVDRTKDIRDITVVRKEDKPLDVKEVVSRYAQSLAPEEAEALSPFLNKLRQEADISLDMRRGIRKGQEEFIEKEVERLLRDKSTEHALGLVAQSLSAWAKTFGEMGEEREKKIQRVGVKGLLPRESSLGQEIPKTGRSWMREIPKRHRGHAGGRGWWWVLRWNEEKLAKTKIIPRRSKWITVGEIGENLLKRFGQKEDDYDKIIFSPFFAPKLIKKIKHDKVVYEEEKNIYEQSHTNRTNTAESAGLKRTGGGNKENTEVKKQNAERNRQRVEVEEIFTSQKVEKTSKGKIEAAYRKERKGKVVIKYKDKKIFADSQIGKRSGKDRQVIERKKGMKLKIEGKRKREIKKLRLMLKFIGKLEKELIKKKTGHENGVKYTKVFLNIALKLWGRESRKYKMLKKRGLSLKLVRLIKKELSIRAKKWENKKKLSKRAMRDLRDSIGERLHKNRFLKKGKELVKRKRFGILFELGKNGDKFKRKKERKESSRLMRRRREVRVRESVGVKRKDRLTRAGLINESELATFISGKKNKQFKLRNIIYADREVESIERLKNYTFLNHVGVKKFKKRAKKVLPLSGVIYWYKWV